MSAKNEYVITFRGDIIDRLTSVYPVLHLVVGYKTPTSNISVLDRFKTVKSASSAMVERTVSRSVNDYSIYSGFVIKALPGTTEIVDADIIDSRERVTL
jgi:hypothetical protein